MRQSLLLFLISMLGSLLFYQEASASGFDLEVSISVPNPNPAIYTNVPVTVTAKNTGTDAGTGIQIRVGVCGTNAFSFVQQNQLVWANTGSSATGTWDWLNQRWTIPTLAPGQTATLNFTLFTLTTNARSIQVFTQASSPDVDSSPGNLPASNGLWVCTANEDDEAVLTLNAGTALCNIAGTVSNIQCNNNGTPSNPSDDKFSFTLMATNPAPSTGFHLFIPQTSQAFNGTYGSPMTIQNIPISTGNLTLNLTDNVAANCSATVTVTAPQPCSVQGMPDLNGIVQEIIPGTNNCFTSPGQSFVYMSMMIRNTGDVAASAFKVKFYFSTDNVLSQNDVLWSTINLPTLNTMSNGGPAFISPNQPVPASLANGQYYVIVIIDSDNQVAESNEANNTIQPFTTQIGAPDVILDSYSGIPSLVVAGSSFNIQVSVKYLANGFTLPSSTSFPVEVAITDISPYIALGSVNYTLSDFSQSNTVTKTVQVTVPPTTPTGPHIIRMNANTSFCEPVYLSNYKEQSVTVTSGGGGQIDLELFMVQNTANPVIYSFYSTTLTLKNKGPQAATGVKVKWMKPNAVVYKGGNEYVASQGSFNPNGDQVWTVGSVPANGSATLTVNYFLLQNGAPVTYAQVIAADQPDVDSQPDNGTSTTVNEDDEAATGGSAPPVLTPDLTISNLIFSNGPGTPGQVLSYNFDLANIGNGNAPEDFIVRAWISTEPNFNTNGIQDGVVPTGNFIAGFSVAEVPGASMLPSTLASGQYYLHLMVDADFQISETNENNNTVSAPFLVQAAPQPGLCDDLIGGGTIQCVSNNSSGQLEVFYKPTTNLRKATLDGMGQVISDQAAGVTPVYPTYRVFNGNFEKLLGGTVVLSAPVPPDMTSAFNYIQNFTEFNSGYMVFAYRTANASIYAIRTNSSFEPLQTAVVGVFNNSWAPSIDNPMQVSGNELAFIARSGTGGIGVTSQLFVLDGNLNVLSNETVLVPSFYGGASLNKTHCGTYTVFSGANNYCHRGSCYSSTYKDGQFVNGQFVASHIFKTGEQSTMGFGTRFYSWELKRSDGSSILANYDQPLPYSQFAITNIVRIEKKQGSVSLWVKYIKLSNASSVRKIAMSGNELVFLSEKNNAVFVEAMNCLEVPNPQPDLVVINGHAQYTTVQAGTNAYFGTSATNLGLAAANGFNIGFYLSTDAVLSPSNDVLVGNFGPFNALPGGSASKYDYMPVPANIASGNYYLLCVADHDNVVVESNKGNNVFALQITITGGTLPTGCNAITTTPGTKSLTIANATAPHVLIKLFNPNWTLNFQCLDNCANPLTINNLNAGTYHLQVKLIDSGWGEICYLEQDVNVTGFGPENGTGVARSDDRQRLMLDHFYPSPTSYQVTVDVFSPVEQAATLDFYDQLGRPVHSMKVQLGKGNNPIQVLVFDWKSGAYNVIARGEETGLPAYGRFLKVWEE